MASPRVRARALVHERVIGKDLVHIRYRVASATRASVTPRDALSAAVEQHTLVWATRVCLAAFRRVGTSARTLAAAREAAAALQNGRGRVTVQDSNVCSDGGSTLGM